MFYNIGVIASGCWEIIKAVFSIVAGWVNDNVITPVVSFVTGLWETVSNAVVSAWNGIMAVLGAVGDWIYTNLIAPVANFFSGLWTGFLNGAKAAWEGIKSVFATVAAFFGDIFSEAWEGVVKVFSIAGDIFTDIKMVCSRCLRPLSMASLPASTRW